MERIHTSLRTVVSFGAKRGFQNGVQAGGTSVMATCFLQVHGGEGGERCGRNRDDGEKGGEMTGGDGERGGQRWKHRKACAKTLTACDSHREA